MTISVVIPAHNEAKVIARCLEALLTGADSGELDIVVVCNGCTDHTADVARHFGVNVIETATPGKAHALNLGDAISRSFPRIYLDADVVITLDTARILAQCLAKGDILAVAPTPFIEVPGCSIPVRAYYAIRSQLPSARQGLGGSGVYALSSAGRARFDKFPEITADDAFVRLQFSADERATISSVRSNVFAPRTLKSLMAIRTRIYYGTRELARRYPAIMTNADASNSRSLIALLKRPTMWPAIATYLGVNTAARCLAYGTTYRKPLKWAHDQSSRSQRA